MVLEGVVHLHFHPKCPDVTIFGPLVLKFCRQFKFSVTKSDHFDELSQAASQLASGEVFGPEVAGCIEVSDRLGRLLCPVAVAGEYSTHKVWSVAEHRLPCIPLMFRNYI